MRVEIAKNADKFLAKLPAKIQRRIEQRCFKLADEPVAHDAKFLGRDNVGDKAYRCRVGSYRIIYSLTSDVVLIFKIEKRERAY
ncbi:type II toxin-antitoxin system RelE/ParE family toxin [Candidatus Woesearchaeota archaeon]|nr:type II toxin-antitoxin system RelE/ParE family toxin [Candidatus Woesearchaeota archaeon]